MAFGTELQGKSSHEALLEIQEQEIRILENLKKCLTHRIKCDRDYATSLDTFVTIAHKLGNVEFTTPLAQAWSTIIKETGSLSQLFRENAGRLCADTLEKVVQTLAEKRAAKKSYIEERLRIDTELNRLQDEVSRLHGNYEHCATKLQLNKAKYEEISKKAKGSTVRLEELRNKYIASHAKFHNAHNEYLLGVTEANTYQQQYSRVALPALLDLQQSTQENHVLKCKQILEEYTHLTDITTDKFVDIIKSQRLVVDKIDKKKEYRTFVEEKRTDPVVFSAFPFESKVDISLASAECAEEIILDALTLNNVRQRCTFYTDQLDRCKSRIEQKKKELQAMEQQNSSNDQLIENSWQNSDNHSTTLKRGDVGEEPVGIKQMKRELLEQHGEEERLTTLLRLLNEPLEQLGDQQPSPGLPDDIDPNSINYEGSVLPMAATSSSISGGSGSTATFQSAISTVRNQLIRFKPARRSNNKFSPPVPPTKDFDRQTSATSDTLRNQSASLPRENRREIEVGQINKKPAIEPKPTSNSLQNFDSLDIPVNSREMPVDVEAGGSLDDEDWYHGVLPRDEVQRLLVNEGDYLVRASKNKKTGEVQYVLSVMWSTHRHFIIQHSEDGWRFEGDNFPTIQELIYNQYESQQPVTRKSEAILKAAIARQDWELKNDDIELQNKIGCGQFGEVFRGTFKKTQEEVAVKTCRENLSEEIKRKFLQEGRILKQYNHPNIVRFIGIATQRHPVMIVMEYISGGSLLIYLRKQGLKLSVKQIVKLCENAAAGMAYLESKNCLHSQSQRSLLVHVCAVRLYADMRRTHMVVFRESSSLLVQVIKLDLAARNCLVGDDNVVKISDFGMSREEQEYVVSGGLKQIPIKWTAPEALNYGTYTTACDVWSYGILMWEIFSLGKSPYPDMTNSEARQRVDEGYRMEAPDKTPAEAYTLMMSCWEAEARDRPHFNHIHSELSRLCQSLT